MKSRSFFYSTCFFFIVNISNSQLEIKIDSLLHGFNEQPSVSVGVLKQGKTIYQNSFGFSNLDYDLTSSNKTVYDMASASKQFTAASILLLENDGELSLNDPIHKYLPEMPRYAQGTITIEHLLHHTSGLRGYLGLIHAKGESWDNRYNNNDVLDLLKKQREVNFKPGSRYAYSNSGYVLLSLIVERISGKTLGKYAEEHIFRPLEMNNTFIYENNTAIVKNRAIGYINDGEAYQREHYFNTTVTGDGGVYTTIEDLFKWSENFKSSKIGNETFTNKMLTTGKLNDGTAITYAGGLVLGDYLPGLFSIGHSGEWGGSRSLFFKFPEHDATFIILSNNGNLNPWILLRPMVDLVLKDEIANIKTPPVTINNTPSTTRKKTVKLSKKTLEAYVGHYYNFLDGYSREIKIERDTLIYSRPDGRITKLILENKKKFAFLGAPNVMLSFESDNSENRVMSLTIDEQTRVDFARFQPIKYSDSELSKYVGTYYSEELDVDYTLQIKDNALAIIANKNELVTVTAVMENIFDAIHFGYLKFKEAPDKTIASFTINDELRRNVLFEKILMPEKS